MKHVKTQTKRCPRCKEEKPATASNFYVRKGGIYLDAYCKECRKKQGCQAATRHYQMNKETVLQTNRAFCEKYHKEHLAYHREYNKDYRAQRKDKIRIYNHRYYLTITKPARERRKQETSCDAQP